MITADKKAAQGRIAVLMLIPIMAAMLWVITSCSNSNSEDYADAELAVKTDLEALKNDHNALPKVEEFSDDVSEAMLEAYVEKLRDFDYEITGSEKSEDGDSVLVTVRITTYDLGSVYLETWNDQMKIDKNARYESQFYTNLFTRIASLTTKDYTGTATIVCRENGDSGEWTTDVRTNSSLMNAISGGMVAEMVNLSEDS